MVFTLSSILCGLAPSLMSLVVVPGLQGVGGAMLMAISPAMITRAFPATSGAGHGGAGPDGGRGD